jgi:phosphatidylinositol alpha-mannosyltransferase
MTCWPSTVEWVRIAQICPYSLTLPGGVQGQVMGLARAMLAAGHEARVLGPCDGPPPASFVTPLGQTVPTASNGSMAPIAPDPSCALRTIRALRDEDFDIIHLHEPLVPGPTLTALLTTDVATVGTFHRAGASQVYSTLRPAVRWTARKLRVRCAVSEDARATATAALGGKYQVLYNGIETERFAEGEVWPRQGPTILFLGRHEPRKGLSVLLDALDYLPSDVRLWVGSDGPQTAELQSRWAGDPRVCWLGRLSDDEVAARLRGADVFCAPSLHGESFGVVLLEAMAARTAIVASDLPGYRVVARDGVEALLVPPGDALALASSLLKLLSDRPLADGLVGNGELRAARFSMESLAERYLELYRTL